MSSDAFQAHLLDQAILVGLKVSFDPALGGSGLGVDDPDAQLPGGSFELT